jgi:hypothetical protein
MKKTIIILVIAGIYWLANVVIQLLELETSGLFGLFPKTGYGFVTAISRVLEFPLVYLFNKAAFLSNDWLLPVIILNSLVWGITIYLIVAIARRAGRASAR